MENATTRPIPQVIFDEIALEGLEGISIAGLWTRLSFVLNFPRPFADCIKDQIWSCVLKSEKHLLFYELPEPREDLKIYDRFSNTDPDFGIPLTPAECPYTRYRCVPVEDGEVLGSCESYYERKSINSDDIKNMTLQDVLQRWGDKFVIVGTQALRYNSLVPVNMPIPKELTAIQYCFWEAIGRSRFNGETTAGRFSLQHYCKDSSIVFYIRNKLIRCGVITQQSYTERRSERMFVSSLLSLPRFHSTNKSVFTSIIEKMFYLLKEAPNKRLPMQYVKSLYPQETLHLLKRIVLTHFFRKLFEVKNHPISEFADILKISINSKKIRQILVVELRNPNLTEDELFADDDSASFKEETSVDFFSEHHSFVDMPPMEKIYRAVERFGDRGCSQSELRSYICMSHLNLRQAIKTAVANGIITSYFTDVGRQRTNMFVVVNNSDSIKKGQEQTCEILKTLQCSEEPNLPPKSDLILRDIPSISVRIKPYEGQVKPNNKEVTLRQMERKRSIINTLDDQCIIQVPNLRQIITKNEQAAGYTDEICNKSLRRLLGALQKLGVVNVFEIFLQIEENIRIYRYTTHPKIDIGHKIMQNEILKLKNNLFLQLEEKKHRGRFIDKRTTKKKDMKKDLMAMYYKSPKFLTSRFLHEYLFYIAYKLRHDMKPIQITQKILLNWLQSEPSLDTREYMETLAKDNVTAYTENITWRTFMPPMPNHEDKPTGWIYFMDAVDRMPLSLFSKLFQIDKFVDQRISEYLTHPIRQHYLIKQLPLEMQAQISRIRLQRMYTHILKVLNHMGLLQIGERKNKDPFHMWVFLNSRARVLDTTTSEPSYVKINPERQYNETIFYFNSHEDIRQYWTYLHRICLHTKLGFISKIKESQRIKQRQYLSFLPPVTFEDAPLQDSPCTPGDSLGAGGLSSYLFAHTFRNWSWIVRTTKCPNATRLGKQKPHLNKMTKIAKIMAHGTTASKQSTSDSTVAPSAPAPITATTSTITNITAATSNRPTTKNKVSRVALVPAKRSLQPKKKNKKLLYGAFDPIDRDALQNMRSLRVHWTKEEDHILKLTRVVYMYIAAPVILFNLRTVAKMTRDILRRYLGVCNKTSQACLRRIQFIVKKHRHLPEVTSWFHMLQTNDYMNEQYGDQFLCRLKHQYPVKQEYSNALNIHFILIFKFLLKLINSEAFDGRKKFKIPDTISEFHSTMKECTPLSDNNVLSHLNPTTMFDLEMAIINNVLHSSLCCVRDKTHYNLQIFDIYKFYTEEVLHAAFKKARNDGLVVEIKRRTMQVQPSQLACPAYIFSNRYRQKLIFLKIPHFAFGMCYRFIDNVLTKLCSAQKESVEFKSTNSGQLFAIAEGIAHNYFAIEIKQPPNILTVDPSAPQSVADSDRILDHFHLIFDNAPQTEYQKQFETEQSETPRQVRVKFKLANLSYKVYYNPYDVISKVNTRHIHFFCVLDHLNQEIDLERCKSLLKDDDNDCSLNCVMKNANYLNVIERIVSEKKAELKEALRLESRDLALMEDERLTIVRPDNLLSIIAVLESIMLEKEQLNDRKDFGKLPLKRKPIDWHYICKEILDIENTDEDLTKCDEFEPTLNKEERIARGQDVFVVNLPTIKLSLSEEILARSDKSTYKALSVPTSLIEASLQCNEIFEKISKEYHWKYVETSLESLKPLLSDHNFTEDDLDRLKNIHDFIQSNNLGVTATELLDAFPDEQFLVQVLRIMREHYIIKRVGVSTFMYVHKLHVRPWVVHSRHIKRLDREAMGKMVIESQPIKRKHELFDEDQDTRQKKHKTIKEELTTSDAIPIMKPNDADPIDEEPSTRKVLSLLITKLNDTDQMEEELSNSKAELELEEFRREEEPTTSEAVCLPLVKPNYGYPMEEEPTTSEAVCYSMEEDPTTSEAASLPLAKSNDDDRMEEKPTTSKRIPKPVERFADYSETSTTSLPPTKDAIVLTPCPWLRVNGSLNRRVLDRWLTVLITECIVRTGISVHSLCLKFHHMQPVNIIFLLELLTDLKCVKMHEVQSQEVGLFTEFEFVEERDASELSDPKKTHIIATADAMLRLSIFIGEKNYKSEFV